MKFTIISRLFIIVLCAVGSIYELYAAEEEIRPITIVGTNNNLPFAHTLPDGTQIGLYVEFWQLWSKINDIPINIVLLRSFNDTLLAVKNDGAVQTGLFINDSRKQWADFALPFHRVDIGILYNRKFSNKIKINSISGLRVGVQSSTFQADYLKKKRLSIELNYYDKIDTGINRLLNNETDAIVAELPSLRAQLAKRGLNGLFTLADEILIRNTVHPMIAKGQPELVKLINQGIENIPVNELIALEKRWLPTLKPFFSNEASFGALTLAEKNWLQNNKIFSLGIETSWYPFEFIDTYGNFKGIAAEYVDYANKTLDIELQPVTNLTWSEAFDALKHGKIDVMSGVVQNPERLKLMNFTNPYFEVPGVIVTRKNSFYVGSLSDLKNKNVGVVRGYILRDSISTDYPSTILHEVDSVADGLEKVASREIDAYVGAIAVVNYEMNQRQLNDVVMIAAFTPYKFKLSMAVRKGLEPLVSILNKTFASMDERQKSTIANNWLSVHVQRGWDLKEILIWSIPTFSFFCFVIFIIVRVNRRLKNEISIREQSEIERQSLEAQLYQSQKMEALGKLTGGIAHDFNNMLGVILGYSDLLKRKYPDHENLTEYVNEIHRAGKRGAKLTSRLLSYTRKQPLVSIQLDINIILKQLEDMLQKLLTVRINLVIDVAENLWPVWLDSSEFEDSLLNICINAMHAMEDNEIGSQLTLRTCNLTLDDNDAKLIGLERGDFVQLTITDNGRGMDKQTMEQIFVPFFSTKDDKGTGLGLSQVYGFVQRSDGAIKVYSELDKGSQFMLFFPRYIDDDIQHQEIETAEVVDRGYEGILIVDDEVALGNLAAELLKQEGYRVFQANSGEEALKLLESVQVDLLLSDILMPEMDGYQLAATVREKYPSIKIQLVSGFTDKQDLSEVDSLLHDNLLYKPYDTEKLFKHIRDMLDA